MFKWFFLFFFCGFVFRGVAQCDLSNYYYPVYNSLDTILQTQYGEVWRMDFTTFSISDEIEITTDSLVTYIQPIPYKFAEYSLDSGNLILVNSSNIFPLDFTTKKTIDALRLIVTVKSKTMRIKLLPNPVDMTDYEFCAVKIKDGIPANNNDDHGNFYIPNAFIVGTRFAALHEHNLPCIILIYNRWGGEVFRENGFTNVGGWAGENAQEGVYVYKINVEDKWFYGTVTLFR